MTERPFPKWMLLAALAAAPSCRGCGCRCFFDGVSCDFDFEDIGVGGFDGSGGGFTSTDACTGCDCCEGFELCWQEQCVDAGSTCQGPADCQAHQICDFTLEGRLLEASSDGGPACMPPYGRCVPAPEAADCTLSPATAPPAFEPLAAWGDAAAPFAENSIVGAPVVLPLDDDNCDDHVDRYDGAEIIFATAAQDAGAPLHGVLHAFGLVGDSLVPRWSSAPATPPNDPRSALAAVRDSGHEALIAVCTEGERIRAYDGEGVERWLGPPSARCDSLALIDVDYDGVVDVISESQVLDGADGSVVAAYGPAPSHGFAVVDLVAAPQLIWEIVTANRIYDHFGTVLADSGGAEGFVAVAGGVIYAVDPAAHQLRTWSFDGTSVQHIAEVDLHAPFSGSCPPGSAGELLSGGPPAVALQSDAAPGAAGVHTALGYVVHRPDGSLVWAAPGEDCDAPTRGSSFFDFDGDGDAEVVRYLGQQLVVHEGGDGTLLHSACNTGEPGPAHPLVADVDADGFGELLAFAGSRRPETCDLGQQAGVQLFRTTAPVTRTRSVYSEFAYRIASTDEDGVASQASASDAPGMRASASSLAAPDLRAEQLDPSCADGMIVRVRNDGAVALPAGLARVRFVDAITLYELAHVVIPVTLAPGAAIDVRYPDAPAVLEVIIDGATGRPLGECDGGTQRTLYCP